MDETICLYLRVLAFKELGLNEVACLFAKDDETYSYVVPQFMCC